MLLLVAGFAAAVVAQGGYYTYGRVTSALLVGLAVVLARPRPNLLVWLGGAVAVWALVRGLLEGDVAAGVPAAVAAGVFAGAVLVAARADDLQRDQLATVVLGVGALVGLTGWVAVVVRLPSWTTEAEGLLRAASTVTYPNAAAAVLAATAVLALGRKPTPVHSAAIFLVCTGIGATMSRAGVIALVAGVLVLCVCSGVRKTLVAAAPPLLGAVVAVAALLPSMPVVREPQPVVAFAGLVAGAAVAVGLPRLGRFLAPVAAVLAAGGVTAFWLADGLATRLTFSSPDRSGATGAALDLVARSPLLGVGPGKATFFFNADNGNTRVMRYVHNEYLQVLVELGAVGLLLALGVVAAVLVALWRGRGTALWAGASAAVVVVLVHSAFDFLWHMPVVLIIAGLCAGLGFPSTGDGRSEGTA
ncbi:hypothetical protein BBK82_09250 [Lentzea guizhouensis]|uniref:O-antigen ligase-related domain-containing protein n=1 Tax=Lentzea guizhouensis TaxID=1586287 RepID=A0A1B2HER3_9PSEU|nr:hypothetical protein BBK82_09250 [Lentzea guizhouensis]